MLLKDLLAEFIVECKIKKFTPKTIKSYRNNCEFLFEYLKQEHNITTIEDLKTIHLKQFMIWQNNKGCKESYLNGLLKVFRAFFKYVTAEEYISVNPVLKISWAKESKTLIQAFTDNEVKRMEILKEIEMRKEHLGGVYGEI